MDFSYRGYMYTLSVIPSANYDKHQFNDSDSIVYIISGFVIKIVQLDHIYVSTRKIISS